MCTLYVNKYVSSFFSFSKVLANGPEITSIKTNATTLEVTWINGNGNNSNVNITEYEVCYQRGSEKPNCTLSEKVTGRESTTKTLRGLRPATQYTVAVRANTNSSFGDLGKEMTVRTNESSEFLKNIFYFCKANPLFHCL